MIKTVINNVGSKIGWICDTSSPIKVSLNRPNCPPPCLEPRDGWHFSTGGEGGWVGDIKQESAETSHISSLCVTTHKVWWPQKHSGASEKTLRQGAVDINLILISSTTKWTAHQRCIKKSRNHITGYHSPQRLQRLLNSAEKSIKVLSGKSTDIRPNITIGLTWHTLTPQLYPSLCRQCFDCTTCQPRDQSSLQLSSWKKVELWDKTEARLGNRSTLPCYK